MKKRVISILFALTVFLVLAVPALADGESETVPAYRLTSVSRDGYYSHYEYVYGNGGYLPTEILSVSEDGSVTYATSEYDSAGRLIHRQDLNISETYVYDDNGDLTQSDKADGYSGGSIHWEYSYDNDGSLIQEERTNSFAGEETVTVYKYAYDDAGHMLSAEVYDDGGQLSGTIEYTYDDAGNRLSATGYDNSGAVSYTYEYDYDEKGRQISSTYTDESSASLTKYIYTPLLTIRVTDTPQWGVAVYYNIQDAEGTSVLPDEGFSFRTVDEPEFVFDENGYLVQYTLQDVATNFAYEPVT